MTPLLADVTTTTSWPSFTLAIESCADAYAHLNGDFAGFATTSPSDYWAYDVNLRAWLSTTEGAANRAAVTLWAVPLEG